MTDTIQQLLAADEVENIDTGFDIEYNAVVDDIFVKTFYTVEES